MDKRIIIAALAVFIIGVLIWVFVESNKPQPGQKIDDLGRNHVAVGTRLDYNSNPPTSGSHFADWKRADVYSTPQEDGYLVHSLEHGYVIVSYNCSYKGKSDQGSLISKIYAHGLEENGATPSGQGATSSTSLSEEFKSEDCHQLVDQLISVYEKKGKRKLIVTPRPNLDSKIALTAWRRIDKFNEFDEQRITKFIDAYRDHGPEQTME